MWTYSSNNVFLCLRKNFQENKYIDVFGISIHSIFPYLWHTVTMTTAYISPFRTSEKKDLLKEILLSNMERISRSEVNVLSLNLLQDNQCEMLSKEKVLGFHVQYFLKPIVGESLRSILSLNLILKDISFKCKQVRKFKLWIHFKIKLHVQKFKISFLKLCHLCAWERACKIFDLSLEKNWKVLLFIIHFELQEMAIITVYMSEKFHNYSVWGVWNMHCEDATNLLWKNKL